MQSPFQIWKANCICRRHSTLSTERWVSRKKRELLTLPEHMISQSFFILCPCCFLFVHFRYFVLKATLYVWWFFLCPLYSFLQDSHSFVPPVVLHYSFIAEISEHFQFIFFVSTKLVKGESVWFHDRYITSSINGIRHIWHRKWHLIKITNCQWTLSKVRWYTYIMIVQRRFSGYSWPIKPNSPYIVPSPPRSYTSNVKSSHCKKPKNSAI